jgi:hypothetical protein
MANYGYQGQLGQQVQPMQQRQNSGSGNFLSSLLGPLGSLFAGNNSNGSSGGLFGGGANDGGYKQVPNINPDQMDLQNLLGQLGRQGLTNPGQSPLSQQARHNFNTQTIPSIAERFTAMGGGQRSGAFQAALGNAGAGLNQGLASLDYQQALPMINQALRPQFETDYHQPQGGALQNLFGSEGGQQSLQLLFKLLPLLLAA